MARPREIELKLDIDVADVERLKTLPFLAKVQRRDAHHLSTVYYDTSGHALEKLGMTLRVRAADGRYVQTVKAGGGAAAGLFDRPEMEEDLDGPQPDLAKLEKSILDELDQDTDEPEAVVPLFETDVERSSWILQRGGALIELTLDQGEVRAGARSAPICEVEMELKRGSHRALFALARECNAIVPLRLGVSSKSERGYRLLKAKDAVATKAEPLALKKTMDVTEGFQAIARACLRHFRCNETPVVERRDVEGLHQMRVALRRLRSALTLFRNVVDDASFATIKSRLQQASQHFGEARNLDVFLENIDRYAHVEGLAERAGTAREAAYDRVVETLTSLAFRQLMLDTVAWLEFGPWCTSGDPVRKQARQEKLTNFAIDTLDAWRRKVKRKGAALDQIDETERHRVRIATKKLRYASEFFAPLFPSRQAQRGRKAFVEALQDLQEALGQLNDLVAGRDIVARLAAADPALTLPSAETGETIAPARPEPPPELLAAAAKAYAGFLDAEPFWR
jgi:inorganic triphosphatase YgiF